MKRLIPFLALVLMLGGCTVPDSINLQQRLDEAVVQAMETDIRDADHEKTLYSYYLPADIGRYETSETGNVFGYEGVRILMSLNTSAIINRSMYPSSVSTELSLSENARVAYLKGLYKDTNSVGHLFETGVFDLEDTYVVILVSDTVVMMSECSALQTSVIAGRMLEIARSVQVDSDTVVARFTTAVSEISNTQKVDLFDTQAPENGLIEELFETD